MREPGGNRAHLSGTPTRPTSASRRAAQGQAECSQARKPGLVLAPGIGSGAKP
jgi:hypothetical protein